MISTTMVQQFIQQVSIRNKFFMNEKFSLEANE